MRVHRDCSFVFPGQGAALTEPRDSTSPDYEPTDEDESESHSESENDDQRLSDTVSRG